MEKYIVDGTKSTPTINLDCENNNLSFRGQSYPENAYKLYEPIFKWIDEYFLNINDVETTVVFGLTYINTSSTKCFILLLEKLNEAFLRGSRIKIDWYYDEENGFDYDMGCEFKEDIVIPFNFIPIKG